MRITVPGLSRSSLFTKLVATFLAIGIIVVLWAGAGILTTRSSQMALRDAIDTIEARVDRQAQTIRTTEHLRGIVFRIGTISDLPALYLMEQEIREISELREENLLYSDLIDALNQLYANRLSELENQRYLDILKSTYDENYSFITNRIEEIEDTIAYQTLISIRENGDQPGDVNRMALDFIGSARIHTLIARLNRIITDLLLQDDLQVLGFSQVVVDSLVDQINAEVVKQSSYDGAQELQEALSRIGEIAPTLIETRMAVVSARQDSAVLFAADGDPAGDRFRSIPAILDELDTRTLSEAAQVQLAAETAFRHSEDHLEQFFVRQMQFGVLILLLTAGVAIFAIRSIIRPLRRAAAQVETMRAGDLSARLGIDSQDEVGRLAQALDSMADALETETRHRRQAEIAYKQSEANYREIFENAMEGIYQTSLDGRLLSANPAFSRILGFSSPAEAMQQLTNVGTQLYVDPDERERFLSELIDKGRVHRFEVPFRHRNGDHIWISMNGRLVFDQTGAPRFIEGSITDISERKRAQEQLANLNLHLEKLVEERTRELARKAHELESANRTLRQLDQMKSTIISSVSHELRTPLTSILGFAKLIHRDVNEHFLPLVDDDRLSRRAKRLLKNLSIVEHEGERLTRLINDFLDITKIESGRMDWKEDLFHPHEVVDRAVDAVLGLVEQAPGVRLEMDVDENLPRLCMDHDRLEQVFINLLTNALKFTPEGVVRVSAGIDPDGWFRAAVSDTGEGIDPQDLESVFDEFFQIRRTDTIKGLSSGTGLGLSICKHIVTHYGGRIWAESERGMGATFHFELPPEVVQNGDPAEQSA